MTPGLRSIVTSWDMDGEEVLAGVHPQGSIENAQWFGVSDLRSSTWSAFKLAGFGRQKMFQDVQSDVA